MTLKTHQLGYKERLYNHFSIRVGFSLKLKNVFFSEMHTSEPQSFIFETTFHLVHKSCSFIPQISAIASTDKGGGAGSKNV